MELFSDGTMQIKNDALKPQLKIKKKQYLFF
jgi:hypothetical protein